MEKFQTITSTYVPLPIENVDTDQIIPARFLKATTRDGFGDNLFADWRYDKEGNPKEDFVLNDPTYSGEVLVAGKNFGSGSSASMRLGHWRLRLQVVVSSFFAIPATTPLTTVSCRSGERIISAWSFNASADPKSSVTVNLEEQTITNNATGERAVRDQHYKKNACSRLDVSTSHPTKTDRGV